MFTAKQMTLTACVLIAATGVAAGAASLLFFSISDGYYYDSDYRQMPRNYQPAAGTEIRRVNNIDDYRNQQGGYGRQQGQGMQQGGYGRQQGQGMQQQDNAYPYYGNDGYRR